VAFLGGFSQITKNPNKDLISRLGKKSEKIPGEINGPLWCRDALGVGFFSFLYVSVKTKRTPPKKDIMGSASPPHPDSKKKKN